MRMRCTKRNDETCSEKLTVSGCVLFAIVFFFKQKTAYEMLRSLVGSEMCIRDRLVNVVIAGVILAGTGLPLSGLANLNFETATLAERCLLYTSDAADDLLCVDLGGRRIIKKKTLDCLV